MKIIWGVLKATHQLRIAPQKEKPDSATYQLNRNYRLVYMFVNFIGVVSIENHVERNSSCASSICKIQRSRLLLKKNTLVKESKRLQPMRHLSQNTRFKNGARNSGRQGPKAVAKFGL